MLFLPGRQADAGFQPRGGIKEGLDHNTSSLRGNGGYDAYTPYKASKLLQNPLSPPHQALKTQMRSGESNEKRI